MPANVREATADDAQSWREKGRVLEVNGWSVPVSEADCQALRMALSAAMKTQYAGRSLLEEMWLELDTTYGILMGEPRNREFVKGRATGLAQQIAIMQGTSLDTVREQAHDRWYTRTHGPGLGRSQRKSSRKRKPRRTP